MTTTVVNIRYDECDIPIHRGTFFGNPFLIGQDGTRAEVIEKYRQYVLSNPAILEKLPLLKGKRLGCVCVPKQCHGQVLAELADNLPK